MGLLPGYCPWNCSWNCRDTAVRALFECLVEVLSSRPARWLPVFICKRTLHACSKGVPCWPASWWLNGYRSSPASNHVIRSPRPQRTPPCHAQDTATPKQTFGHPSGGASVRIWIFWGQMQLQVTPVWDSGEKAPPLQVKYIRKSQNLCLNPAFTTLLPYKLNLGQVT